uniref:EamA domain-containing protein n=1 Tax=mine drainage metagenome TaxID=410659 RepID=E6QI00_9ZZZZ
MPTTAFGYVLIALLGRFWLHEHISAYRWAGILLITLGVGFVAHGPSLTEKANAGGVSGDGPIPGDDPATKEMA